MAKAGIHPNYEIATITCACGAVHETASTRGSFTVEICSKCHPFYTGKQKLMDTAGRIERFQRRYQLKPGAPAPEASGSDKPAQADVADRPEAPKLDKKPAPAKAEAKPEAKKADGAAADHSAKGGDAKKSDKKPAPGKA